MNSDFGDAFFLHSAMSAATCLQCDLDFVYPVDWTLINYGGVVADCVCANCDAMYTAIMSMRHAREWDHQIGEQYDNIKMSAAALKLSIDREAAEGRDG